MPTAAEKLQEHADEYRRDADDDRPLAAYSVLLAIYALVVAGLAFLGRKKLPENLSAADLALGAVATFIFTRTLTKDAITSPLRMPFTRFAGPAGPAELHEEVRVTGWRHAIGELLTCPFCLDVWIATGFAVGVVFAPRPTRLVTATLTALTGADFLQLAYARAQRAAG